MSHIAILVWPNGTWVWDEEVKDLDLFLAEHDLSDDFQEVFVPHSYSQEEVEQLVSSHYCK